MLNVSATQEQQRLLETQQVEIQELKQFIDQLKEERIVQQEKNNELEDRLQALETMLIDASTNR